MLRCISTPKLGIRGNFLQPFLQEKRRVLTAFKLLQGPSGNARLGDWLQRWGEKWDGPKGLPGLDFWMIFGLNFVWCFVMLSLSLSMILWCSFCFGFHILRHPHGTKIGAWVTCVFVNLFKLSPTFARVGPKPAGFTGPHESGPRDHPPKCVISSGSMLNGHPRLPLRQPSLLWPISFSLVQWRSFSWRCNFCISLSSFQSLGGSTSFFSPIGLYSWRL